MLSKPNDVPLITDQGSNQDFSIILMFTTVILIGVMSVVATMIVRRMVVKELKKKRGSLKGDDVKNAEIDAGKLEISSNFIL